MNFEDKLYQEFSEQERRQILADNCDKLNPNDHFTRPLTDREMVNRKDSLAKMLIEIADLEAEKKAQAAVIDGKIKPLKVDLATTREEVKTRVVLATEETYSFFDHEKGYAYTYDQRGNLINKRLLTEKEMQTTVLGVVRGQDDQRNRAIGQ